LPFKVASVVLFRLRNVRVCPSSIENLSEKIGHSFRTSEQIESQKPASEIATAVVQSAEELPERVYAQIDGAMLNTENGWEENKLGIIFDENDISRNGANENERMTIQKKQLVTSLAQGVDDFKQRFLYWMAKTRANWAKELIFISDGAAWIENIIKENYAGCVHILDWFHVKERLWQAANEIYGDGSPAARRWVERYKEFLWSGNEEKVIQRVLRAAKRIRKKQSALFDLYNYLAPRAKMIRYGYFRSKGYYIGSGAIESVNRYAIQDRLKKAGMKWTIKGANAIAFLRTQYLSGNWDQFFHDA